MKSDKIFSRNDCETLLELFSNYHINDESERKLIETLKQQISKSRQMEAEKISQNFVTVDSRIILKNIGNGSRELYHIVLPGNSDHNNKKISVFSGIGAQILGSKIGTVIKENQESEKYYMIEHILDINEFPGSRNERYSANHCHFKIHFLYS